MSCKELRRAGVLARVKSGELKHQPWRGDYGEATTGTASCAAPTTTKKEVSKAPRTSSKTYVEGCWGDFAVYLLLCFLSGIWIEGAGLVALPSQSAFRWRTIRICQPSPEYTTRVGSAYQQQDKVPIKRLSKCTCRTKTTLLITVTFLAAQCWHFHFRLWAPCQGSPFRVQPRKRDPSSLLL